jgi:hypothetical protein
VTGFISAHQEWLDGEAGKVAELDTGLEKTPDRRAWAKVSDVLAGIESPDELDHKVISGIVGVPAASALASYLSKSAVPGAEDILLRFAKVKGKLTDLEVHQLAGINESIFRYLEITDLDTRKRKTAGKNLCSYVDLLGSRKEAFAHFASLFNEGKQKKTIAFIVMEASPVYSRMTKFISGL